jgi:hypothetical protein
MGKRLNKQLSIGGMYSAGDGGNNPDGTVRVLQNYLPRPNRMPSRPPVTYDNVMNANGLANFDDTSSKATRLVSVDATGHVFTKFATSRSETWGAANATTISGHRLTSSANYRGKTYMMFDDGAGLPSAAAVYDGTTVSTSPFNSQVSARSITILKDRAYLVYPRMTFHTEYGGISPQNSYAYNQSSECTPANCVVGDVTVGSETWVRLTTTSLTASSVKLTGGGTTAFALLPVSADAQTFIFLASFQTLNASQDWPLSIDLNVINAVSRNSPVGLGYFMADGGFLYECTTAGTTAGSAPSFTTSIGSTTADGTATWTNRGSATVGRAQTSISKSGDWQDIRVNGRVPGSNASAFGIAPTVKFYSDDTPALPELGTVNIAYKDGLADSDPRKANHGWQLTMGDFTYPFHNSESAATDSATYDLPTIIWSEIGLPKSILSDSFYRLTEGTGDPTCSVTTGNRLIVFRRSAFWQFQVTTDADIPIRLETHDDGIGAVGPLAVGIYEGTVFFIGESDIYAYSVGDAAPTPICGEGMREEIMNKAASSWVESQSTCNRPILCIDQSQLIAWVYTQKNVLYAYDLRAKLWSRHQVGTGFGVECMAWNRNTGNFYVAFDSASHGLSRMVYSSSGPDSIDNTGTTYPGAKTIVFRPIELSDPMRYDAYCEGMQILYRSSGGQDVTLDISENQGASYGNSVDYTPVAVSTDGDYVPMTLDICESGASTTVKLTATGDLGESAWSLSPRATVSLEIMKGEYPITNPTSGASNL